MDCNVAQGVVQRWCAVCGQRLRDGSPCRNVWCHRSDRGFSVVFSAGDYSGALRHAVLRYKYRAERWLAPVFAKRLAEFISNHALWFEELELITGVPAYVGPGARRGFDPVAGILESLSGIIPPGWEVCPAAVRKHRETPAMQGLGCASRQAVADGLLRRSLKADPAQVRGARVVLVDDVMTEGSTLRQVAVSLRAAGAEEVVGLVLARKPWVPVATRPPYR